MMCQLSREADWRGAWQSVSAFCQFRNCERKLVCYSSTNPSRNGWLMSASADCWDSRWKIQGDVGRPAVASGNCWTPNVFKRSFWTGQKIWRLFHRVSFYWIIKQNGRLLIAFYQPSQFSNDAFSKDESVSFFQKTLLLHHVF